MLVGVGRPIGPRDLGPVDVADSVVINAGTVLTGGGGFVGGAGAGVGAARLGAGAGAGAGVGMEMSASGSGCPFLTASS